MFGYIAPRKSELLVRDLALYNAFYCGLCRTIGTMFGQSARLTLSFDSTYIAMLLCGLDEGTECTSGRCAYKPFSKKRLFAPQSDMMSYTAALNVYLAYCKKQDDWHDEKKFIALMESGVLKRAAREASTLYPQMCTAIDAGIFELSEIEKAGCDELDAPADAFARMMRTVVSFAPFNTETSKKVVPKVVFEIGRWIYLADAWDDREKDNISGSYNPFNLSGATKARAEYLMYRSLNEAGDAYELLDIKSNKGVLDNIMFDGCMEKTKCLLGGINEQSV